MGSFDFLWDFNEASHVFHRISQSPREHLFQKRNKLNEIFRLGFGQIEVPETFKGINEAMLLTSSTK